MSFKSKKIIPLSSLRKLTGTPANFTVEIEMPTGNKFNRLAVLEAQVPKTYDLLVSGDDLTFQLTELPANTITITLVAGQYNVDTFMPMLQTALNTAPSAGFTYVVSYDSVRQAFKINTGNPFSEFQILTTTSQNPFLFRVLGFLNPDSSGNILESDSGVLYSNDVIDLERTSEIFVRSNIGSNYDDDLLCVLYPDQTVPGGIIDYAPYEIRANSVILNNNQSKIIRIQLFDDQNNLLENLDDSIRLKLLFYEE